MIPVIYYVSFGSSNLSSANMERSNLYLKLFKLVFGSVSLFASDNEQMLKVGFTHISAATATVAAASISSDNNNISKNNDNSNNLITKK